MNRSTRKFGTLDFISCDCLHPVLDYIVIFKRLIIIWAVFYSGDYFDRVVILFNSRIFVCEYPVGINCPWKPLASADVFSCIYLQECTLCVCVCMSVCIHVYTYIFWVVVFSFSSYLSWIWDNLCICLCLWGCVWSLILCECVCVCVCVCEVRLCLM